MYIRAQLQADMLHTQQTNHSKQIDPLQKRRMACFSGLGGGWSDNRPTHPSSLKK